MHNILATTIACVLDASFGYPDAVYKRIKHPVVWLGAVIAWLERNFNSENPQKARNMGIISMTYLLFITFIISFAIAHYGGFIGQVIGIASLLSGRSLYQRINEVYHELQNGNVETAHTKLANIANSNSGSSTETEICASAIESLATGFGDSVVAPIFWAMLLGLPGIACYKAINTAHILTDTATPRYKYFGQAASILNAAANFIPAHLSLLIIYIAGFQTLNNMGKVVADARKDTSSYSKLAMARALGINLNINGLGSEAREATIHDIERALNLFLRCCFISFIIMLAAAVLLPQ